MLHTMQSTRFIRKVLMNNFVKRLFNRMYLRGGALFETVLYTHELLSGWRFEEKKIANKKSFKS